MELLYTTCETGGNWKNPPLTDLEFLVSDPLSTPQTDLETKAQELAQRIRNRVDDDILALARLLVSKEDANLFGETEFEARDIVHRIGANALEEHLQKKTATPRAASTAPTVTIPPSSTATEGGRS